MIALALDFAFACIGLAVVLCTWRLIKGPEAADRVLALDTLYVNLVALVILLGMRLQTELFSRRRC
jgi:multicomponent K+:H+ antiporter subunit F